MKYFVEMGLGTMKYILTFHKVRFRTDTDLVSLLLFDFFFKIRKVGQKHDVAGVGSTPHVQVIVALMLTNFFIVRSQAVY
jgi:hypothetical protein